ncbi:MULTISPECIES: tetratricopeptide repeat protein [Nostocales]|uniref:Tetratricopeptide repeat protein n=3 Tax=Nostocales TaxID=1161 RepID=A0A8S9T3R8_9CYAN|nr:tetratricopeptide repeat protein [Tolypothrix bouteillei]KAF3886189.1 tetratricopeptide repeat protein [Tolypothrix bouteillei VB521301]
MQEHPEAQAKTLFDEGLRLFEARKYSMAIASLEEALKLDPTYSDAW